MPAIILYEEFADEQVKDTILVEVPDNVYKDINGRSVTFCRMDQFDSIVFYIRDKDNNVRWNHVYGEDKKEIVRGVSELVYRSGLKEWDPKFKA